MNIYCVVIQTDEGHIEASAVLAEDAASCVRVSDDFLAVTSGGERTYMVPMFQVRAITIDYKGPAKERPAGIPKSQSLPNAK